jgi:hypothetical protein
VIGTRQEIDKGPAVSDEIVKLQLGIDAAEPFPFPQSGMGIENILRAGRVGYAEGIIL